MRDRDWSEGGLTVRVVVFPLVGGDGSDEMNDSGGDGGGDDDRNDVDNDTFSLHCFY